MNKNILCPRCEKGRLIEKTGQYGTFFGCSNYRINNCLYTTKRINFIPGTTEDVWVNASEFSQLAFCPKSLNYSLLGYEQSLRALRDMSDGRDLHEGSYYLKRSTGKAYRDRRCFVASFAFGDDHPVTDELRNFRDNYLYQNRRRKNLVEFYYIASPFLVRVMSFVPFGKSISRFIITLFIKIFKRISWS